MTPTRQIYKQPQAEQDLLDIWHYSAQHWGAAKADDYLDELLVVLQKIAEQPAAYPLQMQYSPPVRFAVCNRHLLITTTDATRVTLIRVLHQRMDINPDTWDERH